MIRTIKNAWQQTPDDAARIFVVAIAMPMFFWLYQLAPTQMSARAIFSISVGALGVMVGWLVQEKRDLWGYAVGSCAIGSTIAALGSLIVLDDPTWTWRTVTGGTQGTVVLGWLLLWQCRRRWLSRAIAFWAFLVSAAGFALYVLVNFGLPDPALSDPRSWGWTQPKGIARRVLDLPLDMVLGIGLWAALWLTLRRFLLRHGPDGR